MRDVFQREMSFGKSDLCCSAAAMPALPCSAGSSSCPQAGGRAGLTTQLSDSHKRTDWERCYRICDGVCGFGFHLVQNGILAGNRALQWKTFRKWYWWPSDTELATSPKPPLLVKQMGEI